jgi:hypothetical protein
MNQIQSSSVVANTDNLNEVAMSTTRSEKKRRKLYKLWSHPSHFSNDELVVNPDYFPNCRVGDILEIYSPENPEKKLYLQVGSVTSVKANLQLSVRENIAQVLELYTRNRSW